MGSNLCDAQDFGVVNVRHACGMQLYFVFFPHFGQKPGEGMDDSSSGEVGQCQRVALRELVIASDRYGQFVTCPLQGIEAFGGRKVNQREVEGRCLQLPGQFVAAWTDEDFVLYRKVPLLQDLKERIEYGAGCIWCCPYP